MIGFILLGLVIVAVLAWAAYKMLRPVAAQAEAGERLAQPEVATLDYAVPEGQDPAVVLTALSESGLEASAVNADGRQLVHIACAPGNTGVREQARHVIEAIDTSALDAGVPFDAGPVRFEDER